MAEIQRVHVYLTKAEADASGIRYAGRVAYPIQRYAPGVLDGNTLVSGAPRRAYVLAPHELTTYEAYGDSIGDYFRPARGQVLLFTDEIDITQGVSSDPILVGYSDTSGWFDTFYVDVVDGNDANDGETPDQAWQSLAKVSGETLEPGCRVFFRRGQTFRGELDPSNGGVRGRHVVFDAYGPGADPILSGARLVTTWTNTVGNEYSAACAWEPPHVYADNTQLTLGAGVGVLNADEYFWAANVLHVRLASGDDPDLHTMEATYNIYNIEIAHSYLTFRNLNCDKPKTAAVRIPGAAPNLTNITLVNIASIRAGADAFRIGGAGAAQNPNNVTIQDCTVQLWDRDDNQQYPAFYQREGDGSGGNNLIIENCLVDGWIPWGADTNLGRNGIQCDGGDNLTLHNNEITGCDHGIVLMNSATGWDVAYNWIHETGDDGIFYYGLDDANGRTYNNVLYRNSNQCIDLNSGSGDYGLFAHNTGYEPLNHAISLRGDDGMTAEFKNNLWGITQNPSERFLVVVDVSSTIDIDDFDFDYNLYYDYVSSPVPNPFVYFENPLNNQTWAQWQAAGRDVNGVTADPDFVNAGGTDPEDYKVNAGSPAIDAGETIAAITDDYEGTARPQASGYDIGAFEQ